jgi:hypothetical protein
VRSGSDHHEGGRRDARLLWPGYGDEEIGASDP